jgi:hypothetical protein
MLVWMVERDLSGISMDALAAAQAGAIAEAARAAATGQPVKHLRSLFTPGDGRWCCLFEAADAGAVRDVNGTAGARRGARPAGAPMARPRPPATAPDTGR